MNNCTLKSIKICPKFNSVIYNIIYINIKDNKFQKQFAKNNL